MGVSSTPSIGRHESCGSLPVASCQLPARPVFNWQPGTGNWQLRSANNVEIEVEISDTQGHCPVDRAALVRLVRDVLGKEGRRRASISIALVDQATIHALNRAHLGHDWPTDVISFPL